VWPILRTRILIVRPPADPVKPLLSLKLRFWSNLTWPISRPDNAKNV
jgi:hypothetical protein